MKKRIWVYVFVALAAIAAIIGVSNVSAPDTDGTSKATTDRYEEITKPSTVTKAPVATTIPSVVATEAPTVGSVAFDSEEDSFEWKTVDEGFDEALLVYAEFELEQSKKYQVIMELDEFHLPLDVEGSPQIRYEVDGEIVSYDQSSEIFSVDERVDGIVSYSFEIYPVESTVVRLYFATASLRYEDSFPDVLNGLARFIVYYR